MSESEKSFDEIGWVKFQFEQSWLKEGQPVDVREFAQNASPGDLVLLKELIVLNFDYWWEAHKQKLEVNVSRWLFFKLPHGFVQLRFVSDLHRQSSRPDKLRQIQRPARSVA